MRVLLVRHGESNNNSMKELGTPAYYDVREADPNMSENGVQDTILFAKKLKSLGVKIDKIYTSAFKRSVQSAKLIKQHYDAENLEVNLMIKLHEKGGCQVKQQAQPGLGLSQVREILPEILIDEKNSLIIDENGWNKSDHVETHEECVQRAKEMLKDFKELYEANQGKTILAVSHGRYMNLIACMFTNNLGNEDTKQFIPQNNGMAILDFFMNKNEHQGEGREFVDLKFTAYNLIIHK